MRGADEAYISTAKDKYKTLKINIKKKTTKQKQIRGQHNTK